MIWTRAILVVLAFAFSVCYGQEGAVPAQPDMTTPRGVVERSEKLLIALDFDAFAECMHPSALARFKTMMWPIFELIADKDTTANAAALAMFGLEKSDSGLVDIPPGQVFANFMRGLANFLPEFKSAMESSRSEYIGEIAEGDSLVHIVARSSAAAGGTEVTEMEVVTVRRYGEEWRLELSGKMEGFAQSIGQRLLKSL